MALRDVGQRAILVMGWWLDWMILEMFSSLNDSMIQGCYEESRWLQTSQVHPISYQIQAANVSVGSNGYRDEEHGSSLSSQQFALQSWAALNPLLSSTLLFLQPQHQDSGLQTDAQTLL